MAKAIKKLTKNPNSTILNLCHHTAVCIAANKMEEYFYEPSNGSANTKRYLVKQKI